MTQPPPRPPNEIAFGQYRLIELLGRGGMGEVWRAYDTVTDRIVALKLLPAHFAEDSVFKQRFRREAHAAAQLNEPHVVPIHTYGEINGRLFVDMRLIEGRDLDAVLAEGPLSPERAVLIIEQVARAVHAAHKVGLVHRDIKPSNILLDEHDFAYLIDFGIARAAGDTGLTATGGMIGTLRYMAPERFSSGEVDARSDIYALAYVLYECLTGSRPFPGDSLEQQLAGHLAAPPPRPSHTRPGVPAEFDPVIATGMAKTSGERYSTTVELARAARDAITTPLTRTAPTIPRQPPTTPLQPMRLAQAPYQPQPPPPPAQPLLHQPAIQSASPARPASSPARRLRWILPAAALGAALLVAAGFVIWQHTRPSSTSATPATTTSISAIATAISATTSSSGTTTPALSAVDFRSWQKFGGIDAQVSADGRSVVLDTHDTTENWKVVWSGLIAPGPPQCSTRITGQARDINHTLSVAGGFGIGLTTLQTDSSGQEAAFGSAVQYDFGLGGYFAVRYPTAESYGLVAATLDHEWHSIDVTIDEQGWITAEVDGKPAVHAKGNAVCGMPTLRVWAGAAEFRDFSVQP